MTAYLLLILPSANRVYADAAVELTVAELEVFNLTVLSGRLQHIETTMVAGLPYVRFTADELSPADVALLSNASGLYALFAVEGEASQERREGEGVLLRPVATTPLARFDDDLITIPKYAGKTNEQFTHLLLNVTVLSSASAGSLVDSGLRLLDPLCGRGTTLNQAMVYGYDVAGVELDGKDVEAYAAFLKTYLQRKRIKHRVETVPVRREKRLVARRVTAHITPPHGARDIALDVVHADTTAAGDFFKPASFDVIVTDAPYGVQHGSRTIAAGLRRSPLQLLQEAVPGWVRLLRPGGALGIAWNTQVAKREDAAAVLTDAGLRVLEEGPYGRLRHRVDQSITRDILIGVRG